MTEFTESDAVTRFDAATAVMRAVMGQVRKDQLSAKTPCAKWDVAALINHAVGGQYFFAAVVAGGPPSTDEADVAGGDFLGDFTAAAGRAADAFRFTGVLEKTYTLPFATMPGTAFLDLAITDTFTHAWDLAKATGQSTDLAPDLAAAVLANVANLPDSVRNESGEPFGPRRTAPAGASPADQLAAFLGRSL